MATRYDLTVDFNDLLGAEPSRISARLTTNLERGAAVMDETNQTVNLNTGKVTVANDGTATLSLISTASTDLNIAADTLQYRLTAEASVGRDRVTFDSGWFAFTAAADITELDLDVPGVTPAWRSEFMAQAESLLAQQESLAGIDTTDAAVAYAMENGAASAPYLSATIGAATTNRAKKWEATTVYAVGDPVISPSGVPVMAKSAHTSGATYDPAKWLPVTALSDYMGNVAEGALTSWQWGTEGRLSIAFYGDSITQGAWAGTTELTDWPTLGFVGLFRQALQRVYGNGGLGFVPLFRKEWVKAGTWAQAVDSAPFSACWYATTDTATYTLTTKAGDGDNVDVFYVDTSAAFTYTIDGGSAVTIPATGSPVNATVKTNIALPSDGVHTLQIIGPTSGTLYLVGAAIYKGTGGVVVHNIAKSGALIGDMGYNAGTSISRTAVITQHLNPRLNIVGFMANDYNGQTALATYNARLGYLVDKAVAQGDTLMWLPPDNNNADLTITEAQYRAEAKAVAVAKGIPWLDVAAAWGPASAAAPRYYDNLHPNALGHRLLAGLFLKLLNRVSQ